MRILFFLILPFFSLSQEKNIQIKLFWKDKPIAIDQNSPIDSSQSLQIESLKFYLTFPQKDSVLYLIDLQNDVNSSFKYTFQQNLNFNVGLDSIQNENTEFNGPLDPINGMYWAWNTGYIHFKVIGKLGLQKFEYHIGGYRYPFQTQQNILLPLQDKAFYLKLDIQPFLSKAFELNMFQIMSPGYEASTLAKLIPTLFSIVYE